MAIKSFDRYLKENKHEFFNKDELDEKVLENAKVVVETFKTPEEVDLWHYKHYQGTKREQRNVHRFDRRNLKHLMDGSVLSAVKDGALEYVSYCEKEKKEEEETINLKINASKMRIMRAIAKDNVSQEKEVINPKRSSEEKRQLKLILDSISKGIDMKSV